MNTHIVAAISAAALATLGASAAHADMASCSASLAVHGNRNSGVQGTMSDVLPIAHSTAFSRIKQGLRREGYSISDSDAADGSISASARIHSHGGNILAQVFDDQEMTQTLYVQVEPSASGTKVSITVSYETGFRAKINPTDYCQFIESVGSND